MMSTIIIKDENIVRLTLKKKLTLLISLFFFSFIYGQIRFPNNDSLLKVYNSTAHDSDRFQALGFLASNLSDVDLTLSNKYAKKLLAETANLKDKVYVAAAHHILAYNFFLKNDYVNAVKHYIIAIDLYEKSSNPLGSTNTYNDLGAVYAEQGMFEEAIKCYMKSLKLGEKRTERWRSTILGNIGSLYAQLKKYKEAEEYLKEALRLERKYNKKKYVAQTLQNLGRIAFLTKRSALAEKYFDEALAVADSIGDAEEKGNCLLAMAENFDELSQHERAAQYALKARPTIKGLSALSKLEVIFLILVESERAKANYKGAFIYSDSLVLVREKLYSSQLAAQSKELLEKYQVEKVKKENALLKEEKLKTETQAEKRKNLYIFLLALLGALSVVVVLYLRQKKLREEQKSTELEQKVLRTQMNPHFIFNALNAIQKLYLEKNHEQADEYMGDFGQLLRKILDSSGKSFISLHEELSTLRLYLNLEKNRLEDKMEYALSGYENLDIHHIMVPPLILQPIVENAIWHGIAPKGSGKIRIHFERKKEKQLCITVEDNGVGISSGTMKNEHLHNSKGLTLTRERLKPIGEITMEAGNNGGTKVTITIICKIEQR